MVMNKDSVIILKNPGTSCNIGCIYCAEARKAEVVHNKVEIEDIKRLVSLYQNQDFVTILFHGGEPTLLPIEYYKEIITYCRSNLKNVEFGIQTNATLLDEKWISFLEENRDCLGISVSLDGSEKMNTFRRLKNKEYAFERIIAGIRLLEKNKIQTGMISTITKAALRKEEELVDMMGQFENIRFLKINPCYDIWNNGDIPEWAVTPEEYAEFVNKVFDLMLQRNMFSVINVEPILSIIKNIQGIPSSYCNFSENKCNNFVSLYPKGVITSCDNFGITEGGLGNIYEIDSMADLQSIINFKHNKSLCNELDILLDECEICPAKLICKGGCLAARKRYKNYFQGNKKIYCDSMNEMITHINDTIKSIKTGEQI